ncbi:alpha/beta hydrolase-fold protein [Vibrio sp. PP-XX7]
MRGVELTSNPKFAAFMATEFLPWVRQTLNITPSGRRTLLSGSSYGGLASLYIATQYPHDFGKVLSQSGSFWWGPDKDHSEWLTHQIKRSFHQPIEIYMNAGVFETKPEVRQHSPDQPYFISDAQRQRLFGCIQEK